MEAILGIPLHLHCQEVALHAAYCLHVEMGWRDTTNVTSHRAHHLRDLQAILPPPGNRPPSPVFKVNRLTRNLEPQDSILAVYTDGSKDGDKTGYGWCITRPGK